MSTDGLFTACAGDSDRSPLVLVHGSMDRSAGMLRLSRRLDGRFCVTRYDRRGYGRSIQAGGPFSVSAHVDDLEVICAAATSATGSGQVQTGVVPVRLFGHSFGGNIALALAARRPDLVHSVAVFETPLSWLDWWPSHTAGAVVALEQDPSDTAEAFMRRLIGNEVWEHLPGSTRAARRAEGPAMVGELRDLRARAPWSGEQISVPVLAAYGENGREHHRSGTYAIGEMIPGSTIVELPDAGHGAPNTHADDLTAMLTRFWSAVDNGSN